MSASVLDELKRAYGSGRHELFVSLADWARREGRLEEAIGLLENGLIRYPERVGAWVTLARTKTQMGRLDEARQHYQKILEDLDPRNLPALRALAVAAAGAGERSAARLYLQRWRHEDPQDPEMEDLLAEILDTEASEELASSEELEQLAGPPGVLELGLSELEQKLMPAPSLKDEKAWSGPERARSAHAGTEEV